MLRQARSSRRASPQRARDRRAQRQGAGAARRRRPRRVAHHHRQAPAAAAQPMSLAGRASDAVDTRAPGGRGQGRHLEFASTSTSAVDRRRRRRTAAAGALEPAVERGEVHAARAAASTVALARATALRRDRGRRHRRRASPPEFLPFVFDRFRQADQSFTRAPRRPRPRPRDRQASRRAARRRVTASSEGVGRGATFHLRCRSPSVRCSTVRANGWRSVLRAHAGSGGRRFVRPPDSGGRRRRDIARSPGDDTVAMPGAGGSGRERERSPWHISTIEVPSLLLADIGMPEEDGLSMMRRIRQRPEERGGACRPWRCLRTPAQKIARRR